MLDIKMPNLTKEVFLEEDKCWRGSFVCQNFKKTVERGQNNTSDKYDYYLFIYFL